MPTDQTKRLDDMSRQLHSGETPRSPEELDNRIVQHARQKAAQYAEYSGSVGFKWLGDGWKTALAVFSVAAIAISVTIQVYDSSRTTPFSTNRAVPDAETARTEVALTELPAPADSPLPASAEPAQRSIALDSGARAQAAPSAASDLATQTAVREAESQALGFTDPGNLQLLNVIEPGLVALLSDIDELAANAPDNPVSDLARLYSQLGAVLDVLRATFTESSVNVAAVNPVGASPTIGQLVADAGALVNAYNSVPGDQTYERLELSYQRQLEDNNGLRLPANLSIAMEALDNWLSGR